MKTYSKLLTTIVMLIALSFPMTAHAADMGATRTDGLVVTNASKSTQWTGPSVAVFGSWGSSQSDLSVGPFELSAIGNDSIGAGGKKELYPTKKENDSADYNKYNQQMRNFFIGHPIQYL